MNTTITRCAHFHAGHRVPNHGSKCRMPHGHTYHVEVSITGELVGTEGDEQEGMVLDFGFLGDLIERYVRDLFDHKFIVYEKDPLFELFIAANQTAALDGIIDGVVPVSYIPTAENIGRHIFMVLRGPVEQKLEGRGVLSKVVVWETPRSAAITEP